MPFLDELTLKLKKFEIHKELDTGKIHFQGFKNKIEFRGVTFSYPSVKQKTLENISISFEKGTSTALVGISGAGKSTLIDTLPRLLNVKTGKILIDGKNINGFKLSSLRKKLLFYHKIQKFMMVLFYIILVFQMKIRI